MLIFNKHLDLADRHAFLSPSNYYWLNYSDDKLLNRYKATTMAKRGTDLHALAHEAIRLGIQIAKSNKPIAAYVRDAIAYRMNCEQPLKYSDNAFGTADTISFRNKTLRIHDLKTGVSPTSMKQLEVYAALFCLEYGIDPGSITIQLRIYQGDDVRVEEPNPFHILSIMEKIVDFDAQIEMWKASDEI